MLKACQVEKKWCNCERNIKFPNAFSQDDWNTHTFRNCKLARRNIPEELDCSNMQLNDFVVFCSPCVQLHQHLFDSETTCDLTVPQSIWQPIPQHIANQIHVHRSLTNKHPIMPYLEKNIAEIAPKWLYCKSLYNGSCFHQRKSKIRLGGFH